MFMLNYMAHGNAHNGNIHSTKTVSEHLMQELINAMKDVDAFGSVEIMIQDYAVTQITTGALKRQTDSMKKKRSRK